MLLPLVVTNAGTVVYWKWSESAGHGNLMPYGVVQFGTVALVLLVLSIFPSEGKEQRMLWMALAMYIAAKLFERFDRQIAGALVVMGGHPIKHVAAAIGCWLLWRGIFETGSELQKDEAVVARAM